jgi:hypothetical protein
MFSQPKKNIHDKHINMHLWSYNVQIVNIIKGCRKHIMYMEFGPFSIFSEQLESKKTCKHL